MFLLHSTTVNTHEPIFICILINKQNIEEKASLIGKYTTFISSDRRTLL